MDERTHLSIGEVLSLLRDEFPDITISKIRFLESQGLVDPERTPSGYRKFYDEDVERLRWILRQQRELFLPLKVIKGRLPSPGGDTAPDDVIPIGEPGPEGPTPLRPSRPGDRSPAHGVGESGHQAGPARTGAGALAAAGSRQTPADAGSPRSHAGGAPPASLSRARGDGGSGPAAEAAGLSGGGRAGDAGPGGRPAGSSGAQATGRPSDAAPSGPVPGRSDAGVAAPGPAGPGSGRGPTGAGSHLGAAMSAAGPDRTGPGSPAAPPGPGPSPGDAAPIPPVSGSPRADRAPAEGDPVPPGPAGSRAGAAGPGEPSAGSTGTGRARTPAPASGQAVGRAPAAPDDAAGGGVSGPGRATDPAATDDPGPSGEGPGSATGALDLADTVAEVNLTAAELAVSCGLSVALIRELERFGLVSGRDVGGTTYYDAEAQRLTQLAAAFAAHGVEARHLRMYKNAADRESGLFEQVVMPLIKQRNPNARQQAAGTLEELAALGRDLREILLRRALRDAF